MKTLTRMSASLAIAVVTLATHSQAQTVTLTPSLDGLIATYVLDAPFDRLVFAAPNTVRSDWSPLAQETVIDATGVYPGQAIKEFSVLIRPDSTEIDRGYIALTRLGDGYILYVPALAGDGMSFKLAADIPADWTMTPPSDVSGYVYVGPSAAVETLSGGGGLIAARDVSPVLHDTISAAFADATTFYRSRFGPVATTPTLALTTQGAGPASFRGDVTDTGVISARFNGETWAKPEDEALKDVVRFVFHETSHVWNSHSAKPREGSSWLHEGGAEYMAMVGAISTGHMTEADARDSLSGRLTGCRRAVGSRPDASDRIAGGSAAYDCGTIIQWIADMELRLASRGFRSILDVWSDLIRRASRGEVDYGPVDFRAGLAPTSAIGLILDGPGDDRWPDLERRLATFGVRWENRPSRHDYLVAALFHLNAINCAAGASSGFYVRDGGYIEMDNDRTCGALSGPVGLATIEGINPVAEPQAMFEAVLARCAQGLAVRMTQRTPGEAIDVPCTRPLSLPTAYAVTEAPALRL